MNSTSDRPIKVLYINHYGIFGGSQRSILELSTNFPEGKVDVHFITPRGRGSLYFQQLNIPFTLVWGGICKFDHTKASYYRGLRWLIVLREFLYAFPTTYAFWKFKKQAADFDIVHINEITCILPLILAKVLFKKPVVLHARAVFNNDPAKWQTRFIRRILEKYADRIIAIDQTVSVSIPNSEKVQVVHNGFSLQSKLSQTSHGFAKTLANIPRRRLNIGFMGAIHYNKGILDLLEAIKLCRQRQLDVGLIIVGNGNASNRTLLNNAINLLGLNQDRNEALHEFIRNHQLEEYIHPIGFSTNTNDFFQYIDVICFPTYYDCVGRPVFEAAFFSKPSIVAITKPFLDTFIPGKTGLMAEAKNPESIFNAISAYYNKPELIIEMGNEANKLALKNFDIKKNALEVLQIYNSIAGR